MFFTCANSSVEWKTIMFSRMGRDAAITARMIKLRKTEGIEIAAHNRQAINI